MADEHNDPGQETGPFREKLIRRKQEWAAEGRLLTGRIASGKAVPGMAIHALDRNGNEIERGRITKVLAFRGLKRQPIDEGAEAGDIVAIAGMSKATVADTLCALEVT